MLTIDQAYDLFDDGEPVKAAEACRLILQADETSFPAHYLLGAILGDQGEFEASLACLRRAVSLRPDVTSARFNLASILVKAGHFTDALPEVSRLLLERPADIEVRLLKATCHAGLLQWDDALTETRSVLQEDGRSVDAQVVMAEALHALGRTSEALEAAQKALALDPASTEALKRRALLMTDMGRLKEAFADLGQWVNLSRDRAEPYFTRGAVLLNLKRFEEAVADFSRAIAIKPDYAEALSNRGVALGELERRDEALADFNLAISLKSDHAEAYTNRGAVLAALKRYDEAMADQNRAIELNSAYAEAFGNRGILLTQMERFDEAIENQNRAIALNPQYADAYFNRGAAFAIIERFEEAEADYDRVIAIDPQNAPAHWNKALGKLLAGDMAAGWPAYEWRFKTKDHKPHSIFSHPHLSSLEEARGKTVLVYWEQGLGDVIQFCRYIPLLAEAGARVLFAPQPKLRKLLSSLEGPSVMLVSPEDQTLRFDVQTPLLSLPYLFRTIVETIPSGAPYLFAEPARVDRWAKHIGGSGFRIGICWKGNPTYAGDARRSFSLLNFAALSQAPGVRLISLHKGEGEKDLSDLPSGMQVESLPADFDSGPDAFLDTAAIMQSLDLVITSDTSIAHLAGALGVPVWVALTRIPDFRWMMERPDCPWYPTMRLFRQKTEGDWPGVFKDIEAAVVERAT